MRGCDQESGDKHKAGAGRQEERKEEAMWANEVGRMGPGVAPITSYVTHLTRRT